jgi:hypothetical protein
MVIIKAFFVPTSEMVADGLTKASKPDGIKQAVQLLQLALK